MDAVFYDLGNTLVDYHRGSSESMKADRGLSLMSDYLFSCGISLGKDWLREKFYKPWLNNLFPKRNNRIEELDLSVFLRKIIKEDFVDYERLIALFHQPYREEACEMDGAGETLSKLNDQGVKLGIISNTPVPGFCHDKTLERLGLLDYFSMRFYSYDQGVRKPYKEIFIRAAARAGTEMSRTAMVGDSLGADMNVPALLGMKTFLYDPQRQFDSTRIPGHNIIYHHRDILRLI